MQKTGYFCFLVCFLIILSLTGVVSAAAIKLGASGEEVFAIQARLYEAGYLADNPDGQYGPNTYKAVIRFQSEHGLEADGIVGEATKSLLLNFRSAEVSRAATDTRKRQQLVSFAQQFLGVPYVWAGRTPRGFDCSGFVFYVFEKNQMSLPRMADEQFTVGFSVSKTELLPGDLVFFSTYEPGPSHVGIYMGNGHFIHASSGAEEVTVTPLNKPYYAERYLGARRIIK